MKKFGMLVLVIVMVAALWTCAGAEVPGVLADFTEQASELTNPDTRNYAYCYYDWDEDGEDELFFVQGLSSDDGTWPMNAVLFSGPDLKDVRWSPPKKFKDVAEILAVCMIDIDPADGARDLVFSIAAPDGTEQTMILRGVLEGSDSAFGEMWMDPSGNKILSGRFNGVVDGNVVIGGTMYAKDEGYYFRETGTADPASISGNAEQEPAPEAADSGYAGRWILEEMENDGETVRPADYGMEMSIELFEDGTAAGHLGDEVTGTWSAENGGPAITFEGDTAHTKVENGVMFLSEGGVSMKLVKEGGSAAPQGTESGPEPSAAPAAQPPEAEEAAYVGEWHLIYVGTGGFTGNAADIGLTGETLVLNGDRTGVLSVDPDRRTQQWRMEDGIVRLEDQRLILLREDLLQYGSEKSGYMIFSRDPEAVWDGSIPLYDPFAGTDPEPTETPAEPAPAVPDAPQGGGKIRTEVKYTAKSYVAAGYEMDASSLGGEYSVILHDDGTADFTMAGTGVPGLQWKADGDAAVIDYFGSGEIRITADGEGIALDLLGSMTLKMAP